MLVEGTDDGDDGDKVWSWLNGSVIKFAVELWSEVTVLVLEAWSWLTVAWSWGGTETKFVVKLWSEAVITTLEVWSWLGGAEIKLMVELWS